ncbi:MAG: DUF5719 family protein [Actinomycetota bacterium]|nr:DUF5719 family protein [Actinomycetota bacterium]
MTLLGIVVTGGLLLDLLAPPPPPDPPRVTSIRPVESGSWYCAVGDTKRGNSLTVLGTAQAAATESAALEIETYTAGEMRRSGEVELAPASIHVQPVAGTVGEVGVNAQWWRAPVIVTRVWTRGAGGEPQGVVAGPCEPDPASNWYLPGVSTVGGAQARIVVSNPFDTDAAVSVTLLTPDGRETPELLKNVGVASRSVRVVDLNAHAPERADLGAVVAVRAGRVVAEAWQSLSPAIGGIEGVTLAKLAPAAAQSWTVPWFPAGDDAWIWVANVGHRPTALELTVHTANGGVPPEGLEEVIVAPGTVRRLDLRGVLPSGARSGAATVAAADGGAIVVSGATQIRSARVERSGLSIQLGSEAPDSLWMATAGSSRGRGESLHLVNPTAEPVVVDVRVVAPNVDLQPAALQGVSVPAGAVVDLDLVGAVGDLGPHTVFVTARSGQLILGLHGSAREGRLGLVAYPGVPSSVLSGGKSPPPVEFAPALSQRIGTRLGPSSSPHPTLPSLPALRGIERDQRVGEDPRG